MIRQKFNTNWVCQKGTGAPLESVMGGAGESMPVTLPHDAMIGQTRDPNLTMGGGVGFFPYQNVAYLKDFNLDEHPEGTVCWLEFEGVYMNAEVHINGSFAGKCPYGYSNFYIDGTRYVKYGQRNSVRVVAKNAVSSGRWYTGGGIYRDVSLMIGPPLHISPDGIKISTPDIDDDLAIVRITTLLHNNSLSTKDVVVHHDIIDADGSTVAEIAAPITIFAGESKDLRLQLAIYHPLLWQIAEPYLYTCHTSLSVNGLMIDDETNRFGIRKLQLDSRNGLRINGQPIKLHGGCIHHDNGVIGAIEFKMAAQRRISKLKAAGYNAIRMAHHPASKALLEACDELGMLVMDEFTDCWTQAKVAFDYGVHFTEWWEHDLTQMVAKDYNHPSVIMYSIGNEITEVGDKITGQWGKKLADKIRQLDDSRYTINCVNLMMSAMNNIDEIRKELSSDRDEPMEINTAMNTMWAMLAKAGGSEITGKITAESFAQVDIAGYNYAAYRYEKDLAAFPNRFLVGSETTSASLDVNWQLVKKYPRILGDFNWTAYDYLGEVGIGEVQYGESKSGSFYKSYPWRSAFCGDLDLIGDRRPISYWRDIVWGTRSTPYVAVQDPAHYGEKQQPSNWGWTDAIESWTWQGFEDKPIVVEVYAAGDEVELLLDGISLGRKSVGQDKAFIAKFDTIYRPGRLEAIAYAGDQVAGRYALQTSSSNVRLQASCADTSIGTSYDDIAFIEVSLVDHAGVLNPQQDMLITAEVGGQGSMMGFGSANPCNEDNYLAGQATSYHGRALLVVRSNGQPGTIDVTFNSEAGNALLKIEV